MFKNKAIILMASAMLAIPVAVQAQGVTPTAAGKGNTVSADQLIARYTGLAGSAANAKSVVNGLRNGADITLASEEKVCTATQTTCKEFEKTCSQYEQKCTTTPGSCTSEVACPIGTPGCVGGRRCVAFSPPQTTCVNDTSKCVTFADSNVCKPGMSSTTCTAYGTQLKNMTFQPGPAAPMGFGNVDIALALTEAKLGTNKSPNAQELKDALMEILNRRASGEGWGKIARAYGFQLQE